MFFSVINAASQLWFYHKGDLCMSRRVWEWRCDSRCWGWSHLGRCWCLTARSLCMEQQQHSYCPQVLGIDNSFSLIHSKPHFHKAHIWVKKDPTVGSLVTHTLWQKCVCRKIKLHARHSRKRAILKKQSGQSFLRHSVKEHFAKPFSKPRE